MIKLSSIEYSEIAESAFRDELEKIAVKVPYSGGLDIPIQDFFRSSKANAIDAMKFHPIVKGIRKRMAEDLIRKRKGLPMIQPRDTRVGKAMEIGRATVDKTLDITGKLTRQMSIADTLPMILGTKLAPMFPGVAPVAYAGVRLGGKKLADTALDALRKKGLAGPKPTPHLRDASVLKKYIDNEKKNAFNREVSKLDLEPKL